MTRDIAMFDQVRSLVDLPDRHLRAGMVGRVVEIYDRPSWAFEVEFVDAQGVTIAVVAMLPQQVERA